MSNEFFNPFHFVPVEKPALAMMRRQELAKTPPERKEHRHVTHDRYMTSDGVYSGRIVCKLTLVTPTVVGARRDASTSPAVVAPYEVLAEHGAKLRLEPALPETSLRGMISSVFESATNSALRVLNDRALSVRQEVPEAMQAVGMIRERNGARYILPLALPLLKSDSTVPAELRPFARQMQLKCYFNGFSEEQSSTADTHAIYFAKLTYSEVNLQGRVFAPDLLSRGSVILGRRSASVTRLMPYQQWSQLPTEERKAYVPGVLRNLGRCSLPELQQLRDEEANEERSPGKVLPTNVKHRWFIPLRPSLYDPETNTCGLLPKSWSSCYESPLAPFGKEDFP